jgi:hypothetical protein
LLAQCIRRLDSRACSTAGKSSEINMPTIADHHEQFDERKTT